MKSRAPLEGKQLAQHLKAFIATPLGEQLLRQLSLQYNTLHQEAEGEELTAGQKAFKVERAAGTKWAIDYIMTRVSALDKGMYDDKQV